MTPLALRQAQGERISVMEPRIQYAKTSDGVSVAFIEGSGRHDPGAA
jgi:hypothetical protein